MSIVHRRVFYAKAGAADQLVQHLQEGEKTLQQSGGASFKMRTLTDYMSGRSDRVATEWEMDNLGDMEAAFDKAMSNPQAQAFFGPWMEKLHELICYSEAENWSIR